MSYAIFKGETTIKDLVTRLFTLPDKTAKTAKQAADALIQANPQLSDLSKVPPGTIINIPSNAPPLNSSESAPAGISRQVAVTFEAQTALSLLDQSLANIDARATTAAAAFLALAQSPQLQALAQNQPELKEQVPLLLSSAQSQGKAIQAQQTARVQAVSELQFALQASLKA